MIARAKRIDNGKWIEGYYMRNSKESKDEAHVIWFEEEVRGVTEYDYEEIDPSTLVFPEVERLKAITKRNQLLIEHERNKALKVAEELIEEREELKKESDKYRLEVKQKVESIYKLLEEKELLEKQNAELLESILGFRRKIYRGFFTNMELRSMVDAVYKKAIQQAEGGEK